MLWIIAAIAGAVMLAGIAFLALRGDDAPPPTPRKKGRDEEYEEPDGGTRLASDPPPSGIHPTSGASEELPTGALESQELWLEEDEEPTGPVPKIVVMASGGTHPGQRREHNEDAFLVLAEHDVYAIADGMGGYAAGEVASAITVDSLAECFALGKFGALEDGWPRRGAELAAAIREANTRVRQEAAKDESKQGMGTTIVAARFSPGRRRVYVAHVGDSRCYRIRGGELKQLTMDHTLGAVGIKGPAAGKLSRAVGVFDDVDVDLTIDEPAAGDYYLLCSDGLFKMVPEAEILPMIMGAATIQKAVDRLIEEANARGGRDNISVVLVRIDEPEFDPGESGEHRLPG
ncbi:MAG: serine/threonine-protein phosphatase [Sandaracinaceae bacterium]|nr:serine/threonine-protein phosphatase [Sandaracinaceae bacterium]